MNISHRNNYARLIHESIENFMGGTAQCQGKPEGMSMDGRPMDVCLEFEERVAAYKEEWGEPVTEQTLIVLASVLWWLRRVGYGELTLSAVDHRFSHKLESRSFILVRNCLGE
jgi:hypothetical protein